MPDAVGQPHAVSCRRTHTYKHAHHETKSQQCVGCGPGTYKSGVVGGGDARAQNDLQQRQMQAVKDAGSIGCATVGVVVSAASLPCVL